MSYNISWGVPEVLGVILRVLEICCGQWQGSRICWSSPKGLKGLQVTLRDFYDFGRVYWIKRHLKKFKDALNVFRDCLRIIERDWKPFQVPGVLKWVSGSSGCFKSPKRGTLVAFRRSWNGPKLLSFSLKVFQEFLNVDWVKKCLEVFQEFLGGFRSSWGVSRGLYGCLKETSRSRRPWRSS